MSQGDFIGGLLLMALPAAAAGLVVWRVLGRRPDLDRLERFVAGSLVFCSAIAAIHLLPLALTILSRGTVAVVSVLTGVAALLLPPKGARHALPVPRTVSRAGTLSWAVAALAGSVVGAAIVSNLREWLPQVPRNVDTLTFHLPNAATWIQTGSMWRIDEYLPRQPHGYYPNNGELLYVWSLLPFHNEFFVRPVIVALLLVWAVAMVAIAREIGASVPAGVTTACAMLTIPIVGIATVPRAMPDVLLYASMTAGLVFVLRHRRSGSTGDLVLGGLGLGLALGTKWYGLPVAGIGVAMFCAEAWFRDRTAWRRTARQALLLGGTAVAGGAVWMVRNLVESGNPLFPVRVSAFGVTLLDAPSDTVRAQVGFSVAHYLANGHVLFHELASQLYRGMGPAAVLLAAVAVVTAGRALARRRRVRWDIALLAAAGVALAIVYVLTPYTALGTEGHPTLARFNTRYAVPALICWGAVAAWVATRWRWGIVLQAAFAGCAVAELSDAYGPLRPTHMVAIVVLVVLVAAALLYLRTVLKRRSRGFRLLVGTSLSVLAALAGTAYARRAEQRFNHDRYAVYDPTFRVIEQFSAHHHLRVGVTGFWPVDAVTPVWPSFGPRMGNVVRYVGYDDRGFLTQYAHGNEFGAALARGRFDLLIVGRGLVPRPEVREMRWAEQAGWVEITRSPRLVLYGSPSFVRGLR